MINEVYARVEAMLENAKGLQQQAVDLEHEASYVHWTAYIDALEDVLDIIKIIQSEH